MRFALSKVDLAIFFMAPTWPLRKAYADDTSDQCHQRHFEHALALPLCLRFQKYCRLAANDVQGQIRTCMIASARSCAHGEWSVRLVDCLSQGDFWPAETHRDPSGDKPQHELAGVSIIIRQVISKRDAASSVLCHDPHFKGRRTCRKAVPVHRQPMSLGKVEEHCRIATCGNDPPGRRIRLEPVFFKILLPRHTLHSILST